MTFFKPGISSLGRALERSQEFVPWMASLQAWGGKSVDLGHCDVGLARTRGQLVGVLPVLCQVSCAPSSPYHVQRHLCSRRHLSVCLSLFSKECESFPRDLSWTAARRDDISCSALGRDRSPLWVPGCLILPASLDTRAPVPWGWTDSAQQVRRRQQVSHTAFSATTDHSISLGTFPFARKKWEMQDWQQQRHSKLTFGMLPADHGSHLQVPEFRKPNVSVCTVISSDNKVPSVSVYVIRVRFCILAPLNFFLSHNKHGDVQTHFHLYFLWVLS